MNCQYCFWLLQYFCLGKEIDNRKIFKMLPRKLHTDLILHCRWSSWMVSVTFVSHKTGQIKIWAGVHGHNGNAVLTPSVSYGGLFQL